MELRNFQPGDEEAQARVYNTVAGSLPGFKPATAAEVARRYQHADPSTKFYAVADGQAVGYAVFDANGRVSYPWCLPDAEAARAPLLEEVIRAMREAPVARGLGGVSRRLDGRARVLREHGFDRMREIINYVADLAELPDEPLSPGHVATPLGRDELPALASLAAGLVRADIGADIASFFWENPLFSPESLIALRRAGGGEIEGIGLVVQDARYADPMKLDAGMPCFRLGALGTERERHKRVNGMFCVFRNEAAGAALLAEAGRRLGRAGSSHVAAQAPSDRPDLVAFYDRYFRRQGAFPRLARRLTAGQA